MSDTFMAAYERAEKRNDLVHAYEWNNPYYKNLAREGKINLGLNSTSAALLAGNAVYNHKKAKKLEEEGADEKTIKKHKRRRNWSVAGSVLSGLGSAANVVGIAGAKHYDKNLAHMTTERGKDGKNTYTFDPDEKVHTMNSNGNATAGGVPAPKKNYNPLAIAGGVTGAAALTGGVAAAVAAYRKKKKKKQQEEEGARNANKGGRR